MAGRRHRRRRSQEGRDHALSAPNGEPPAVAPASTTDRVLARYHTVNRRPDPRDGAVFAVVEKAFDRTLGPLLPASSDARCVDVACGEGALLLYLRSKGFTNLAGIDLSPENVAMCRSAGLDVTGADALALDELGFAGTADLVTAFDIVEHVRKEQAAGFLESLGRVLRPGGTIVLQTPNLGSVTGVFHRYNDLTHELGLTEKTVVDLAVAAGFDAESVTVLPAWSATTPLGHAREVYAKALHAAVSTVDGAQRPRIASRNLLAVIRPR